MKNIKKGIILSIIAAICILLNVQVYAADRAKPVLTIAGPNASSVSEGGTVTFTVDAKDNEGVSTFSITSDDIDLNGFTGNISISGTRLGTKTIKISNIRNNGGSDTKTITIASGVAVDSSNNKNISMTSAGFTIKTTQVTDKAKPVLTIAGPNTSSIAAGGSVTYTVTAKDNVGVTKFVLNSDYIELHGFTANISVLNGTITLSNVRNDSTTTAKYITVKSGVATDAAGNTNIALDSAKFTITQAVDRAKPVLTIVGPNPTSIVAGGTVTYTVTANDNVGVTKFVLNSDYIELHGFTANISVNEGKIVLSNIRTTDYNTAKYITVKSGVATDAAGNKNIALDSAKFTMTEKQDVKDTIAPVVSIGNASPSGVYVGGTIKYVVTFSDNVAVTAVDLTVKDIKLNGFTANIAISGTGLKTRTITLSNIKGNVSSGYTITIAKDVIKDAAGNVNVAVTSPKFSILKKTISVTETVVNTTVKGNCIDDLSLLGDINKEITYFSSWLRAEKYTAAYVQENNYVAEGERMTYMVEYYNGSTAPAPNVVFTLTIPYKVDVEEINGGGYIKSRTDKQTVIEWNMGKIASGAYCRLYVRVKFNENTSLEASKNISETFYATLKTTAGGNTSYSYMRQLFIDKTEGKTGTYKSYLSSIDSTNSIRPEDEITRAEFAKLLADCGIITVDANSTAYKTYKDWESIPVYARAAVAALTGTDIIQAFPDGTFKPNNPILMEDAIQMIAQAARYISDTKLTITKPTFLYTSALKDTNGDLSEKKDYIMELMRQNVIVKYESNPDTYALRKDVVAMVNALTFRGPYVEKLPQNTLKFVDIREDSLYFYNIIGASNSYTYTYDYRLWQEIVEINN